MAKEMQRTCKRDNTVWYVSMSASRERRPGRMEQLGIRLQYEGSKATVFGGSRSKTASSTQLLAMEDKIERVSRNGSCPACGSSSYTQKKVRK